MEEENTSVFTPLKAINGPCARHGHSCVVDESGGGLLLVFGGCDANGCFLNDVYIYNHEKGEWLTGGTESAPRGRQYHTAVLYEGYMLVFGGNSNGYFNDLHRYHVDSGTWEEMETTGSKPSPRYGHSAVLYNGGMYIFGGYDKNGMACNEIFVLDIASMCWKRVGIPAGMAVGITPPDRYHHSAVVHQGSMYLFGGHHSKSHATDLLEYRFGTCTWSIVRATSQVVPSPRWGHNAFVYDNVMYVFGGRDTVGNTNDLWSFHFDTLQWSVTTAEGVSPRFFSSVALHDQYLLIFGGRNVYNFSFNDLYCCDLLRTRTSCTLISDMRTLLLDGDKDLSDVTFYFPNEQKSIHCHRAILSARCKPFKAMFSRNGFRESEINSVITISKVSHDAFLSLIDYLYTGQLCSSPANLVEVLQASDLYQLDHLKRLCEKRIVRYADPENAIYLFQMADKFKANELRAYCLRLIVRYQKSLDSRQLDTLNPDLHAEVSKAMNIASRTPRS